MTKKILIVGPAWLGDMVMAQALFRHLKQRGVESGCADVELHVLAPEWNFAVLQRMPEVSRSIVMPVGHEELKLAERYRLGKILRKEGYDQAIVLANSFKSALIPFFANIPIRTGWTGELRFGLINDMRFLNKKRYPLMVQRFVALGYDKQARKNLQDYPKPKLIVDKRKVPEKLAPHHVQYQAEQPILALSAGAAFGETKRWPTEYFATIANEKLDCGWHVWLFGSAKDAEVNQAIQQFTQGRCVDFSGKLQLDETVDFIAMASLMVSNDSGLLHVAAALDVPVVGIYGSTTPDFTPPLSDKAVVVAVADLSCRPCFKRICPYGHLKCLKDLIPQRVAVAMQQVLAVNSDSR